MQNTHELVDRARLQCNVNKFITKDTKRVKTVAVRGSKEQCSHSSRVIVWVGIGLLLKRVLDGGLFTYRLGMQMQPAGCIYNTNFYTETLGPADTWMEILFNISHSSSSKRIASFDRARVSAIMSQLNHYTVLLMMSSKLTDTARQTRDACRKRRNPALMGWQKSLTFETQTHDMHLHP